MSTIEPVEVAGQVIRIVFTNPENHWTVLRLNLEDPAQVITVVGTIASIREGERLRVWGQWVDNQRYGRQLKTSRYEVILPASAEGIERYLASGIVPGIGPKTARLLVKRFGTQTLDVIEKNPERLRSVKGIGRKKVAQILSAWRERSSLRDTLVFLHGLGISGNLAVRIFEKYGTESTSRVRANPYELAQDVRGVGFLTADRIARELKIGEHDPARLRAGLLHVLREARSDGHVCLPREQLLEAGEGLLQAMSGSLGEALETLSEKGRVVIEQPEDLVYTPELYAAEVRAAEHVIRLVDTGGDAFPPEHRELIISQAEASLGIDLAEAQRDAVETAISQRVSVITGGPGTGKTTIVRAIVSSLKAMHERIELCAPTGRAAKRLSASTDQEARTIHRLLEWKPNEANFTRDERNPIDADAVIVDEVSMVDLPLFDCLLRALEDGARLILVGDVNQLPSVGPGKVLHDVISSEQVRIARLTQIFRQKTGSLIVDNAHRMLSGELPESPDGDAELSDFYWIERDEPEEIRDVICRMVRNRIPAAFGLDATRDVQVLTPMHRGPLGSESLNQLLAELLNPSRPAARLAPGDKVMQIRNNYEKEVFNGDVGFVERYANDSHTLMVRFGEGDVRIVTYGPNEQEELVPAWAISIHKSQGSEYPAVVIPVHTQHFMMLRRNLIYTAITRGKQLVILVGSHKALRMALASHTVAPRYGRLAERFREFAR